MSKEVGEGREVQKTEKRPPRPKRNPIEAAINSWYENCETHLKNQHSVSDLIAQAPKRWTAYGPLVLLPAGSFTTAPWREALGLATSAVITGDTENTSEGGESSRDPSLLWKTILEEITESPKIKLTHLAINEEIPLHSPSITEDAGAGRESSENILRSPSGLRMLYGDFGPSKPSTCTSTSGETSPEPAEVMEDFARAFWVSTRQNGITQIWAPRWTMFSRGNVKEKARLLKFHDNPEPLSTPTSSPPSTTIATVQKTTTARSPNQQDSDLSHRHIPADQRAGALAVDLYSGIGYFAFCYAALGFRVLCWELNAWSVEGLRRGAEANGWSVKVVRPPAHGSAYQEGEDEEMLQDILSGNEKIIVFLETNARAADRIRKLDSLTREHKIETGVRMADITHVNCGLLPTSRGSWATAWDVASEAPRVWLHIHENVGVSEIEGKKNETREWFAERARDQTISRGERGETGVCVEHVELVKTYAPGVWHCVFDLYVTRSLGGEHRSVT
ncbi:S-adenosyl-L-methionine-dependent methyltransferase [Xylaria venustula]|nr:S-adenosyl-L-methionine-dependent methyltransferase [Xylaria venustula]